MPVVINGSTGISGVDGSAGTPSYVGGDSDTGLWYPAANTLALSTSGSERLRIDSSGNLALGQTTTTARFTATTNSFGDSTPVNADVAINAKTIVSTDTAAFRNPLVLHTYTVSNTNFASTQIVFNSTNNVGSQSAGIAFVGNSNALAFYTNGGAASPNSAAGTEAMRIDSAGRILIGTTATVNPSAITPELCLEGLTNDSSTVCFARNSNDIGAPNLYFAKSRGTSLGSKTIVQNGDFLGIIGAVGADGSDFDSTAAEIRFTVDGTPGVNDMPGRIEFRTTADGAASATERMRITSGGNVGINNNNPSNRLQVEGSSYLTPYIGSGGLNIIASYSYNDNNANTIGGQYQDQVTTLMIATSGIGYTALPIYCNAGAGVAYRWTYLDPDSGTWIYSGGANIDVTFTNAGGVQNTYRVIITDGGGSGTIQRTAGSTPYVVYVQRLIGA